MLTGEQLAPLQALLDATYPDRLREVAELLFAELLQDDDLTAAFRPEQLAALALRQTERLSLELGGGQFYMHKGTAYRLSQRDRRICARFTGDNYAALAREEHLTETRIRQILDAWQRENFERRQVALFAVENAGAANTGRQGRRTA